MRYSGESNLKKESVMEINDISVYFSSIPKIIKMRLPKKIIPHMFMPSHRPSSFTLRNKLICLKGTELSQEIFHPAITWGVTQKMFIFTPILDPIAHIHIIGGLMKVSIINL